MRPLPILIGVLAALALGGAMGLFVIRADTTDEPSTSGGVYRWRRLSIELPEDSGLQLTRGFPIPEFRESFVIEIFVPEPGVENTPTLTIDADTGEVLIDTLSGSDPAVASDIIASIALTDELPEVWPYVDADPADLARSSWGAISFVDPPPEAGVVVTRQNNYCVDPCARVRLTLNTGYSSVQINAETGEPLSQDATRAEDQQALQRFVDSVEVRTEAPTAVSSTDPATPPAPSTLGIASP